jgi:hypothetical protein
VFLSDYYANAIWSFKVLEDPPFSILVTFSILVLSDYIDNLINKYEKGIRFERG